MHNNKQTNRDCLDGVRCSVTSCIYNCHGNNCEAKNIKVASENAEMKMDTFCSTFSPKNGEMH